MRTANVGTGNLLVWIFLTTNIFAQSGPPDGHDGGITNEDSPLYVTPDYGTNLWLSLNLSNGAIRLLLHNTQPGMAYQIRSREKLNSGSWLDEATVTGATAAITTPAILNASGRTNSLFIQAYSWMTNTAGGTISMITISGERIMELTHNRDVISWGGNGYGELGDYTHLETTNPVHAVGLTGITKIASGLNYSLAVDSNGILWAWGQLDVSEGETNLPMPVPGMTNITAIAAYGQEGSSDPAAAVKADGTVWMWGMSDCDTYGVVPEQIAGLSNVVSVTAGNCQTFALMTNGTVWMWGYGNKVPAPVPGLSNITAIRAGDYHTLALAADGTVWAWGDNGYGQLGDGGAENYSDLPVLVVGLTNVIGVAAGIWHSQAVDGQGRLWAWGGDDWGQLGDAGSGGVASQPFQVPGLSNIVSVAAGSYASAALDAEGHWWQWGAGSDWPFFESWGSQGGYPRLSPTYVDFYSGRLPVLQVLNGNHQTPHAGLEFPQPLVVRVTDANGVGLSNAPVSVEVISGDIELRVANGGNGGKGLRLTTDTNGEVTIIGSVDQYASHTNCLIRVLAASREQITAADFTELLVPLPAINITSPAEGANVLVGSNQNLTITVDAHVAPGGSIQEVDYSYHLNGGEETPLGISAEYPFSFTWTNSVWWTDGFVGQYTLTAVAVDNVGVQSEPQNVNITVALDSNGNGLPDFWQLTYFGLRGVDPDADPDGDGVSNLLEYQHGTVPTDFYNGHLPYLEIMGGNDQPGCYDSFLPKPVIIKVSGSESLNTFIANAPVMFAVTNGTALLAATTNDIPVSTLNLRSDSNGRVSVRVYFPPSTSDSPDSTILASAISGTNSTAAVVNEFVPLGHWTFNDTNTWTGEAGELPLMTSNLANIRGWSSNAVLVESGNPALLAYNVVETDGNTNINCRTGSVLFWFKPDWSSTNVGGNGPGAWGRLIEMGDDSPAFSDGWWGLYLSPDGTQLLFGTSANGGSMTNLCANISWCSNEWYQIALTYSPTGSALYVDGQLLANGTGVTYVPDVYDLTNGFRIGSDQDGNNRAGGAFDELETFDYPLASANTATCSSQIPDWWEIKYFGRAGMDPDFQPARDGMTLWLDYQFSKDPNVIAFTLSTTNQYVASSTMPVQLSIEHGEPSRMAVAVITTNFVVVPNQLFDINNVFADAPWRPYDSNIVVSLNSGDGEYYIWVGLKGVSPDARSTWKGTRLAVDTAPPILMITNPVNGIASRPIIQLQGCVNESLSSLAYDVSNAAGVWTNQTGYVTGHYCDTNLLAITTNYFQCYNVVLTTNGDNLITFHAADLAGNTSTTNLVVIFDASADTNPPDLTVIWPQSGISISGSNFTLQAQVSDPMTVIVASIVDGNGNTNIIQGLVEQSGLVWVQNLPLAGGTNMLAVIATDSVGNTTVTNLISVRSSVSVMMNPLAEDQLNQSSVSVGGTVSDPSCAIIVNGAAATVNPDGTWRADNVLASSIGTATFDVEVYSGTLPDLGRANLDFSPMDAPLIGNAGSQSFAMKLPVKVGLMSFMSHTGSYGVIAGGSFAAVNPCCGPAFGNNESTVNWTYLAGGSEAGYDYSSGYYNCPPGSPGWSMIASPRDDAWSNPLPIGRDAYAAPWGNVSDAQYYFRTHVMIEPQGQAAAGSTATYLVQARAWAVDGGGQLAPYTLRIRGVPLMDDGTGSGHIIFSAPGGINVDVTPMAPRNNNFTVQATELNLKLAVDNNRDGQITFDESDLTTPAKPYRFWINDSLEAGDISDAGNDIPGNDILHTKVNFPRVNGPSDSVNFFPVALCLSNVLQSFPTWCGYEYHLSQKDGAVDFVYADLSCTNPFEYLTSPDWWNRTHGDDLYNILATLVTPSPGVTLNDHFLNRILANGEKGVILAEGIKPTQQPLELEIWYNGRKLASAPLYLRMSPIEDMYRHLDLRDGADVPSGLVGEVSSGDWTKASQMSEPPAFPDVLNNGGWLVFVHGYNVSGQEARGWESEMFKRFYWSYNRSRFVGVAWFGDPRGRDGDYLADYHCAVMNAFATAPKLAEKIGALAGSKTIVAHSLGCGIVASAITDHDLKVDHTCLFNAALAAECFDGDAAEDLPNMAHPAWVTSSDPSQPYYPRELWASDWYKLFLGTSDARKSLTWKNRFANAVDKTDIHSFFSSTEDVLAPCPGMPGSDLLQSLVTSGFAGAYAWAIQEKGKGNAISVPWAIQAGSDYGGWGFNLNDSLLNGDPDWYLPYVSGGSVIGRRVKTMEEIGIVSEDLLLKARWTPLFKTGWGRWDGSNPTNVVVDTSPTYYSGPPWIFDLYARGATGSDVAAVPANRAQLLAEAIPALSGPTGSRFVTKFGTRRNYDMPNTSATAAHWPRGAKLGTNIPDWRHSDMHDVAYPYLYDLYNRLVSISEQ